MSGREEQECEGIPKADRTTAHHTPGAQCAGGPTDQLVWRAGAGRPRLQRRHRGELARRAQVRDGRARFPPWWHCSELELTLYSYSFPRAHMSTRSAGLFFSSCVKTERVGCATMHRFYAHFRMQVRQCRHRRRALGRAAEAGHAVGRQGFPARKRSHHPATLVVRFDFWDGGPLFFLPFFFQAYVGLGVFGPSEPSEL